MKLSEKIYNKKDFKTIRPMLGSATGYDASQVDYFLDEVVVDVERMEKEIVDLNIQVHNFIEEKEIERDSAPIEGYEELVDLRDKLKRKIEQYTTFNKAMQRMYVNAEQTCHNLVQEANEKHDQIVAEAKEVGNGMLKKVEERCAEKEREIQRLESREKEFLQQFASFGKMIEKAVSEK